MMSVCRDLGTFGKRNKNQLRDYMTAGPGGRFSKGPETFRARKAIAKSRGSARLAEIPVSRCRGIPPNRAEIFPCNRVCQASPAH